MQVSLDFKVHHTDAFLKNILSRGFIVLQIKQLKDRQRNPYFSQTGPCGIKFLATNSLSHFELFTYGVIPAYTLRDESTTEENHSIIL